MPNTTLSTWTFTISYRTLVGKYYRNFIYVTHIACQLFMTHDQYSVILDFRYFMMKFKQTCLREPKHYYIIKVKDFKSLTIISRRQKYKYTINQIRKNKTSKWINWMYEKRTNRDRRLVNIVNEEFSFKR